MSNLVPAGAALVLCIACSPVAGDVTHYHDLYTLATEMVKEKTKGFVCQNGSVVVDGFNHYKYVEFGKGPALLEECFREIVAGLSGVVVVRSTGDDVDAFLRAALPKAAEVFRA